MSDDATGYRIDYTSSGGDSDSVTVSGGSTDMRTLTGLQNGDTYTISIVATSDSGLPSESVMAMAVGLGKYFTRGSGLYIHYFWIVPWPKMMSTRVLNPWCKINVHTCMSIFNMYVMKSTKVQTLSTGRYNYA